MDRTLCNQSISPHRQEEDAAAEAVAVVEAMVVEAAEAMEVEVVAVDMDVDDDALQNPCKVVKALEKA